MKITSPTEQIAQTIVSDIVDVRIVEIKRFPTGKDNYVYNVKTETNDLVVRLNKPDRTDTFNGAMYWYNLLKPKGVPLPTVHSSDVEGKKYEFPYMVMDRLPGIDLVDVYSELATEQKESLAAEIVSIQQKVSTLDQGKGYGYATSYDDPKLYKSWRGVMDHYMNRIVTRNAQTFLVESKYIHRLAILYEKFSDYMDNVKPTPFLDDTTTKNVIVHNGKLSGIVDVDYVCFGDPLLVLALTQMSLLAMKTDTHYTCHWAKLLNLSEEQQQVVSMYSAMFALEFASTMGHTFNKAEAEKVDQEKLQFLTSTFDKITQDLV